MSQMNIRKKSPQPLTHEGAPADRITAEQQLRRSVMACMLWEDSFYEDGQTIAERIAGLVKQTRPEFAAAVAAHARWGMKLRHAPLLVVREMARLDTHKHLVSRLLPDCIGRPDEITEFLSIYWKDGKQPLSAQVKKGLAAALTKFDEHAIAKYNRDGTAVRLRDVLFLSHAKPADGRFGYTKEARRTSKPPKLNPGEQLFRKLVEDNLATPDTWEVALSAGEDKGEVFARLMAEKKLGALAFLRNLRNMTQAGVSEGMIKSYAKTVNVERVLPFRFIAAAKYAPHLEPSLEEMMFRCLGEQGVIAGKTVLLVDNSDSMHSGSARLSEKSELVRADAAAGVAMLMREVCDCRVFAFSDSVVEVPPRRGFALRDGIWSATNKGGTQLGSAARSLYQRIDFDRLIVITDEQSHDPLPPAKTGTRSYIINVAANQNGVGYKNGWHHIDGWSEAVIDYIRQYEADLAEAGQ